MPYTVRALDAAGCLHTLSLDALDGEHAGQLASAQGLTPLTVQARPALGGPRAPAFDVALFAQELHALADAGLGVVEALDTLLDKDPAPARRAVIARLLADLRAGQRLSSALRRQGGIFPPLFVGMVQAAEGSSELPLALRRYMEYGAQVQAVRHKVLSAAIYPAVLLTVGALVTAFLLGYVVPRFAAVYDGSGRELPAASQALMAWGGFAARHAGTLAAGLALVALAAGTWARRQWRAGGWGRLLPVLPGAAAKLRALELSRLYLTLGMLVEGGIPLLAALHLCEAVVSSPSRSALHDARAHIEAGESLSEALQAHGLSTPVALRLLRAGEQSGRLAAMLSRTARFHEDEAARWIDRFSKTLEPVLMAVIGAVIGLLVILLYMPIFELAGSLS